MSGLGERGRRLGVEVSRKEGLDALEFTSGVGGELAGVGLESLVALAFEFAQGRDDAAHAAGGAGARTTVGEVFDFGAILGGERGVELRQLFGGLLDIELDQLAEIGRVAVGEIEEAIHVHGRGLIGRCGRGGFWAGVGSGSGRGGRGGHFWPPMFENAADVLMADGFGEVIVHAGGEAFLAVALHGVGGHGNDGDAGLEVRRRR